MSVLDLLEYNPFTQDIDELIRELNDRVREINDYHRDAETEGLLVFVGPNGFTTALDNGTTTVTTSTTLDNTYYVIEVDASSGDVTLTLPASASNKGRHYHTAKVDSSSNDMIIDGNSSETIIGELTIRTSAQWDSFHLYCNGTGWILL